MGAEAYGLIGFFSMLQAWFNLLDIGLTPTISRETARFRGGVNTALFYRQLYRSLSVIFFITAFLGALILFFLSELIANSWIDFEYLALDKVLFSLQVMSICIAFRWMCGLYRGVITGFEKLILLSGFNIAIATLRFLGVFLSMYLYGFTPDIFFIHQLVVAALELFFLWIIADGLVPKKKQLLTRIGWSFKPVCLTIKFALSIAVTSSLWVFVTQTDKLILSGILTMAEYGYFTLAVLLASSIMIVSGPISNALLPRMAMLHARKQSKDLLSIYRKATRFVCLLAGTLSLMLFFFSNEILYIWTGDLALVAKVSPILSLYAAGNGFLVISAFPYYLQYANGNLRYHLAGSILLVSVLIPSLIVATKMYGSTGAGYTWLFVNILYFLIWVAIVHMKLSPGLHFKWLSYDVIASFIIPFSVIYVSRFFIKQGDNRLELLFFIGIVGLISLIAGFFTINFLQKILQKRGVSVEY
tara:strand:+ start:5572 stop:6987 length:1416 start_codon:yes stop_codon:yes gene_type:complete